MSTNTKISTIVSSQLPEFVRDDHPNFVSFLEAYYQYLEQSNNTINFGKTIERAKNLVNYYDIDRIDQQNLSQFSERLYNQFLAFIPKDAKADRSKLLKNIKDFYRGTGTEKSYDFIFRILFGEESTFYYPKDDILKASSGKWLIERSIRLTDIVINDVPDITTESLKKFNSTLVRGNTSTATAQVEKIVTTYETGTRYVEFFLSKQRGSFIPGESFFAVNVDGDTLSGNLLSGFISSITITDGGSGYLVGTPIEFEGGAGGTGASAFISNVSLGNIAGTIVLAGGAGFKGSANGTTVGIPANPVVYSGGGGEGAAGYVAQISANGGFHPTYYRLCVDRIDEYTAIRIGEYANNAALGDANTPLSNTWSYVDYGPIGPAVSVEVNEGGSGYTSVPVASISGNTILRALNIPGRLKITNPGEGYSNGDLIIFKNRTGTYGYGSNAYVTVDANGSIIRYTWNITPEDELVGSNTLGTRTEHIGGLSFNPLNLPDIAVVSQSGGVNAVVEIDGFMGFGESLTSTTGTIGQILGITITNKGYGYTQAPSINLSGSGDGTATAFANADAGVFVYPGKYIDDTGLLSGTNKIEDRDYYQNYSYVVKLRKALNSYRQYINDLVHPAGTRLWAEFDYKSNVDIDSSVSVENGIYANYIPHFANSYNFSNLNSIIYKNSTLHDISAGNTGAISFWFNTESLSADQLIFSIANTKTLAHSPRFSVILTNRQAPSFNSVIRIESRDSSNVLLMRMESNSRNKILTNNWIHVLSTWDLRNVTNNRIFVNEVNSTNIRSPWTPTSNLYTVGGYISGIDIIDDGQGYNANGSIVLTNGNGANVVYTYNAATIYRSVSKVSINDRGRGYNANGYIIFDGGIGGSGANASYRVANSLNVLQPFSVNVAGDISGAANSNVIVQITLNNSGTGYLYDNLVGTATGSNISPASFTVTTQPYSDATQNTVSGITIYNRGFDINALPSATASGSNISPASFVVTLGDGYIEKITITSGGTGYNSNGYLSFTGGGGSEANARYIIANSQDILQSYSTNPNYNTISRIEIVNPGSGYTSLPTVTAFGSNITAASFIANVASSRENEPTGIFFKPDGTSMFIVGHDRANISQYNLSTPWNVSTAKFVYGTANTELSYVVDVRITNRGQGYNSNGSLVFTGGAGSGTSGTYTAKGNGKFTGVYIGIPPAFDGSSPGRGYSNGYLTIEDAGDGKGANIQFSVNPVSGTIFAINVKSAGHSYDPISPPRVLPPPHSLGNVTHNKCNVSIDVAGTGYSNGNYLVITGGGGSGANISYEVGSLGNINKLTIVNAGSGYTSRPTITAGGSNTSPASFTAFGIAQLTPELFSKSFQNVINSVTITSKGTGYSDAPLITASGSNISPASFVATMEGPNPGDMFIKSDGSKVYVIDEVLAKVVEYDLSESWNLKSISTASGGFINSILLSSGGQGYNSNGYLIFTGGGGTGANASYRIANSINVQESYSSNALQNVIVSITIHDAGTGYTSIPTVTASGSNITEAIFAASISQNSKNYLVESGNVFVSSRATNTHGLTFSNTGTYMYVTDVANSKLYQYTLGTPWSVNSATYTSNLYIGNIETNPQGIFFDNSSGSRMYVTGISAKGVSEYRLSTPWDITTARHYLTHTTDNEDSAPRAAYVSLEQKKVFIAGDAKNNVREYNATDTGLIDYYAGNVMISGTSGNTTSGIGGNSKFKGCLSEIWFSNVYVDHTNTTLMYKFNSANGILVPTNLEPHVLSEWANTGNSYNVRSYEEDPRGLFFSPDGFSMYVIGYLNANISKYNLSTPWDVNTASFVSNTLNVGITSSGSINPSDMFIKPDGTRLYVITNNDSRVRQFDMSETWNVKSISQTTSNAANVNILTQGQGYNSNGYLIFSGGGGTGLNVKYIANIWSQISGVQIDNGGTGYPASGTLSFTPVDGLGACAVMTYTSTGGVIDQIQVIDSGFGYKQPPVVTASGSPTSPASFTAFIGYNPSLNVIDTLIVNSLGTGYYTSPTAYAKGLGFPEGSSIDTNPSGNNLYEAVGSTANATFSIRLFNSGYMANSGEINVIRGYIETITITASGNGYNSNGFLTFTGGGGSGANASYRIANSLNVQQSYSSDPLQNTIVSITIHNRGSGYTSFPTIGTPAASNITPATFSGRLSGEPNTSGLFFSNTGTYMYVTGTDTDKVHQYTLATPWDVTTATYTDNVNVFVQTTETQPTAVAFNKNGLRMFVVGTTYDSVYEFSLQTPWDVTTATYLKKHDDQMSDISLSGLYYDSANGAFLIGAQKDSIYRWYVNTELYTSIYLKGNTAQIIRNYGRGGNFNFANSVITCNNNISYI